MDRLTKMPKALYMSNKPRTTKPSKVSRVEEILQSVSSVKDPMVILDFEDTEIL